jgi:putative flippase GtrA
MLEGRCELTKKSVGCGVSHNGDIESLLARHPRVRRFLRYSIGSISASIVSAVTLAFAFRGLGLGPEFASVAAFATGALVAFLVNRLWAWERRERPGMGKDFLKYAVVAIVTALIALACTTIADSYAKHAGLTGLVRLIVVEGAYFGSYAVTFVAKFVILDRFVFNASSRATRSRDQVENTTRA